MKILGILLAAAAAVTQTPAHAQELGPLDWDRESSPLQVAERDERFLIQSEAMGEYREIIVRLPARYHESEEDYPVFYVTDADWNFELAAGYLDYLRFQHRLPPIITVGIRNVDRNRDFVPRADPGFPNSGQADNFVRFLSDELMPAVNARYRTSGYDTLYGHSFGGTIALHTLFDRPGLFDAHIALSPSNWVAGRVLFEEAETFFASPPTEPTFVYMAVGETDGGPTVPDGQAMADVFEARAPENIDWSYTVVPSTNHFSVVMPAFAEAIERLYPGWGLENSLRTRLASEGIAAIEAWFAEQEAAYGARFYPQAMELGILAAEVAANGEAEQARALMTRLREEFSTSADMRWFSAYIEHHYAENTPAALAFLDEALRLGREDGIAPNTLIRYQQVRGRWTEAGPSSE